MKTSIKILSIIIPTTAAVIIAAGGANYLAAEHEVRALTEDHLNKVSALTAREVSASLKSLRDEMTWIARHPSVQSMDWDQMSGYLSEVADRTSERLTNLMLIEKDGSYFFAGQGRVNGYTLEDRQYFQDIMVDGSPFSMADPDLSRSTGLKKYTLAVAVGSHEGVTEGLLASNISLDILSGMLMAADSMDGFMWVVDSRGYVIGSQDKEQLLEYNLKRASAKCEGMGRLVDAVCGRECASTYMTLEDGERYFATCQPVSGTPGWALISAVPDVRLTSLAKDVTTQLMVALAVAIAIMGVTVWRIVGEPEEK